MSFFFQQKTKGDILNNVGLENEIDLLYRHKTTEAFLTIYSFVFHRIKK